MNGYDTFAPTLDGLVSINADEINADEINTVNLNGISSTVIGYLSNARSSLQTQIDSLTQITGNIVTDGASDIFCNTLTSAYFVNCNSGIVNATWSANKVRVDDDVYYPDGTFGASPKLQDIVDAKIAISTTLASTALAAASAFIEGQITVINTAITAIEFVDLGQTISIDTLNTRTRYISTDYTELAGIPLTGGNTYCSSNFRIGSEGAAPISLYPDGQISATKFVGDECNVDIVYTDEINSKTANANIHIGSKSLTDVYLPRTITIGDNFPLTNCTVKTTNDLTVGGKLRANTLNTKFSVLNTNLWIGDDGTDGQITPRFMFLGDYFGNCTVSVLAKLEVATRLVVPVAVFDNAITVGNGIALIADTGVATAAGVVCNALTINNTLNGIPIGYFTGTTSNLQAQMNLKAPLAAPAFTGIPTAPTAAAINNSTQIATTAYVKSQLYALKNSEYFTGTPTADTPIAANNTTRLATTAFVQNQVNSTISGVTLTGIPLLTIASSPVLTDNSYRIASTTFVKSQAYATLAAPAFTGAVTFTGTLNTITPAVFAFLSGATSNIQTQLNNLGGTILGATNTWTATNTFSGLVRITNTTPTTSGITGALVVSGGVGIGDDLYVVGDGNFQGDAFTYDVLTFTGTCVTHNNTITGTLTQTAATTNITSTLNTTLTANNTNLTSTLTTTITAPTTAVVGNLTVSGTTGLAGITTITNTTASSNYNTGAFLVKGGVGITGVLNTNSNIQTNGIIRTFDVTDTTAANNGALVVSGGVGIAKKLYVTGMITGTGGISISGGAVTLAAQGDVSITGSDISVGGSTTTFDAVGGHKFIATSAGLSTTFCIGCAEVLYAAYGLYALTTEKIYMDTSSTAEYLSTGATTITAGTNLLLSAANSVIFNSHIVKDHITISTSTSYTFATMASVPNIVFVYASAGGVNIYLPDVSDAAYNGLQVTFRLISGSAGVTIRITNNPSRLALRTSTAANSQTLAISAEFSANLLYIAGNWYDTR